MRRSSGTDQDALNLSTAMLLQQRLARGSPASSVGSKRIARAGFDSFPPQAVLKNQEDHLTALLLERRRLDEYMAAAGGSSAASNPLLQRRMLLGGIGVGSVSSSGAGTDTIKRTLDEALNILQSGENADLGQRTMSNRPSFLGVTPPGHVSSSQKSIERPQLADEIGVETNLNAEKNETKNNDKDEADEEHHAQNEQHGDDDEQSKETTVEDGDKSSQDTQNNNETFPFKLYRIIKEAEKNGQSDIISFFPHNRAFAIHKPRVFVTEVMPKYFTTSRMSSFQRQLNLYGFKRITEGPEKGGYYHEHFLKGHRSLCKKIKRKRTALVRAPPNFLNNSSYAASPFLDARQATGNTTVAAAMAAVAASAGASCTGGSIGASSLLDLSRQRYLNAAVGADSNNLETTGSLLELSRQGLLNQVAAAGVNDLLGGPVGPAHGGNQTSSVEHLQQELMLHQLRQRQLEQELLLRRRI